MGNFYNGSYGEFFYPLSDLYEIWHQSSSKTSNCRGKFGLDRARSENNTAEKSFALGNETDIITQPINIL